MIQEYLQQRTPRERLMLLLMSALLGLVLLYVAIIEPVVQGRADLQQQVERSREVYASIHAAAQEAKALRGGGAVTGGKPATGTQSLMGSIEQSARQKGLAEMLKSIQPSGKTDIGIWFERCRFDTLLSWLTELEYQYGLQVKNLEIERIDSGIVNARVVVGG